MTRRKAMPASVVRHVELVKAREFTKAAMVRLSTLASAQQHHASTAQEIAEAEAMLTDALAILQGFKRDYWSREQDHANRYLERTGT